MPQPKPRLDDKTLPDPELNPLLNPLLGAHMGRWAEVYFTSPPEKRSEAVAELLRELGGAAKIATPKVIEEVIEKKNGSEEKERERQEWERQAQENDRLQNKIKARQQLTEANATQPKPSRTCETCGHKNSAEQNFCGMCGIPLQTSPPGYAESKSISDAGRSEPATSVADYSVEQSASADFSRANDNYDRTQEHLEPMTPELSNQSWTMEEADVPHFAVEPESVPYRYRLYIGAVLALLLASLLYMAWRGKANFSGDAQSVPSRTIPDAPSPAPTVPPSAPAAPAPGPAATTLANSTSAPPAKNAQAPSRASARPASPGHSETKPGYDSRRQHLAEAQVPARAVHPASANSPVEADQGGQEELATAEKYLNGSRGNDREAVPWLWKAVAKGNLTATITLSDMYLRGDGVSKSCDQGRLLLDAAARKGNPAAAGRLRNLRAFGCQ